MKRLSRLFFTGAPSKEQNGCITKVFCLALFCLFTFSIIVSATAQAAEWYVDYSVENGDGTSWETAFDTIQEAIDAATTGDEILVEGGTYPINSQINVDKAVDIYGGFDDGNIGTNETIVDGQGIAYHCFYITADATIDGFTITGGDCYLVSKKVTAKGGGGINIKDSSPTITNCTVTGNKGTLGGGIYISRNGSPTITNCDISENRGKRGGGLYSTRAFPIITNCTLFSNSASKKGGGMYFWRSDPTITNCTFSQNHAVDFGGGIFSRESHLIITNCILWGDYLEIGDMPKNGPEITSKRSTYDVTYCDIEWGFYDAGEGCILADPFFVDVDNGDLHLTSGSPCIDTGTNDAPELPETDKDGNDRIIGESERVDMGAYEFATDD